MEVSLKEAIDVVALGGSCIPVGISALWVLRWLSPRLPADFRIAVYAYVIVISGMVVLAASAWSAVGDVRILAGAVMFFVSDLAVARQRFVTSSVWNARWGLPLYFGGQLVLAASVG